MQWYCHIRLFRPFYILSQYNLLISKDHWWFNIHWSENDSWYVLTGLQDGDIDKTTSINNFGRLWVLLGFEVPDSIVFAFHSRNHRDHLASRLSEVRSIEYPHHGFDDGWFWEAVGTSGRIDMGDMYSDPQRHDRCSILSIL